MTHLWTEWPRILPRRKSVIYFIDITDRIFFESIFLLWTGIWTQAASRELFWDNDSFTAIKNLPPSQWFSNSLQDIGYCAWQICPYGLHEVIEYWEAVAIQAIIRFSYLLPLSPWDIYAANWAYACQVISFCTYLTFIMNPYWNFEFLVSNTISFQFFVNDSLKGREMLIKGSSPGEYPDASSSEPLSAVVYLSK